MHGIMPGKLGTATDWKPLKEVLRLRHLCTEIARQQIGQTRNVGTKFYEYSRHNA